MTISQALKEYSEVEAEILISHILSKTKEFLYLNPDHKLTHKQQIQLKHAVNRRLKGEPIGYILGYKDFCGLRFKVNKDVLIPRPETEELVQKVIQVCKVNKVKSILDMGTGSGCITVSLAKQLFVINYPLSIIASDVSEKALKVAKENAKNILRKYSNTIEYQRKGQKGSGVKIRFVRSDLFLSIKGKFDIVVANLPYVPLKYIHKYVFAKELPHTSPFASLKYEPPHALTDGGSSYVIYEKFFKQVPSFLNTGAVVFLEIDPPSRKQLTEWSKKYLPNSHMKFHKDLNGLYRFMEITTPS